jgi:hypothetical protein
MDHVEKMCRLRVFDLESMLQLESGISLLWRQTKTHSTKVGTGHCEASGATPRV